VWRDGVVVKGDYDPPLFAFTPCRSPTMQRSATSVVIRCAG
jgi:hypothetical protein